MLLSRLYKNVSREKKQALNKIECLINYNTIFGVRLEKSCVQLVLFIK